MPPQPLERVIRLGMGTRGAHARSIPGAAALPCAASPEPHTHMRSILALLLLSLALLPAGCRTAYYETLELFGRQKRDVLVSRVESGRAAQERAADQVVDTLAAFQELVDADPGDLGKLYERLRRELVRSEDRAAELRQRIDSIETVAQDLFAEWEDELETMQSDDLRARSQRMLDSTRDDYGVLVTRMREAADRMDPVLVTFRDHVTFLKHSLNAQAVATLRETRATLESDVEALIADMQTAIAEADEFLRDMRQGEAGELDVPEP